MERDEQIVALVLTFEHSQLQLQTGIDRIPGPSEEVRRTSGGL